jgi:hypothetical protein
MRTSNILKVLFPLAALFVAELAPAQIMNSYCKNKIDSLLRSGTDTVIFYQPFVGPLTHEANECCMIYERTYLLWRSNGALFILKQYDYYDIDKDTKGKKTELFRLRDTLAIFGFLDANFQRVVSDKLLRAKIEYSDEGKAVLIDYSEGGIYDDCHTAVSIFADGKEYENGYSGNDLNDGTVRNVDGTVREKRISLNYEANINKAIYKLITKIERQVLQSESIAPSDITDMRRPSALLQ